MVGAKSIFGIQALFFFFFFFFFSRQRLQGCYECDTPQPIGLSKRTPMPSINEEPWVP